MNAKGTAPGHSLRSAGALVFESALAGRLLRAHRNGLLDEALARGLSPTLEAPLRYLATGDLPESDRQAVERVEATRSELATSDAPGLPDLRGNLVSRRRLAQVASVDRRFGTLLYLCAKSTGARVVLELGGCVGIGTSYLALAGPDRVISIEASPERAEVARASATRVNDHVKVIVGRFDDALPGILEALVGGLDMAWIDGHHRRDATLRYFESISPRLNEGAVVAFDDIRWSPEMREAWQLLQRGEGFADTIDLGPIGLGVWQGGGTGPRVHDLRGIYGRPRWLQPGRVATNVARVPLW
jgi:predicted O-methyltransferase YrrM